MIIMTKKEQDTAVEKGKATFSTLREKQTVYSTDANPYHGVGQELNVHPETAKALIAKGFATEEPVSNSKKEKGKKGE